MLTPAEWQAVRLSLLVALCAAMAAMPLAVGLGYLFARGRFAGKWLLEAFVTAPLVLPPVVTGYLLLVVLGVHGPIGSLLESWFGVRIVFTWVAAVIAALVVSLPLMVRAIRTSFESIDVRLEQTARGLGATRWSAFWNVSLPLARRGLMAGWILGFARSLGEFGATIMVAGNVEGQTRTIPIALYSVGESQGLAAGWRLVVVAMLLALVAIAASEWLERRQSRHDAG